MHLQVLVLLSLLGLSAGYMKDDFPYLLVKMGWVNFLEELKRGDYKCTPKVGMAIDISSSIGNIAFFGQAYPLIMMINEYLAELPFDNKNKNTGADLILIPFHQHTDVIDLNTNGRKLDANAKKLDKALSSFKVAGGSCIACAWHEGGQAIAKKIKRTGNPGFLMLISDGRDNDYANLATKTIEEAHKTNVDLGIHTMTVGVQGWRPVARKLLQEMSGVGHNWELPSKNAHDVPDPVVLRALAWSITNQIAANSCEKL